MGRERRFGHGRERERVKNLGHERERKRYEAFMNGRERRGKKSGYRRGRERDEALASHAWEKW